MLTMLRLKKARKTKNCLKTTGNTHILLYGVMMHIGDEEKKKALDKYGVPISVLTSIRIYVMACDTITFGSLCYEIAIIFFIYGIRY